MEKVALVLGLGVSGVAAAEFLLSQGIRVIGIDRPSRLEELKESKFLLQSEEAPIDWPSVGQLIVSPGISPKHPIYAEGKKRLIPIMGEAELALPHFTQKMVAITGTNGKTTVALLTEYLLNACGIKAKAIGNVGTALCHQLKVPAQEAVFIVELSSYQLETMRTQVFDAGVILNITPDHLDRYANMQEYALAKCNLQHLMKNEAPFFVHSQVESEFRQLLKRPFQTYNAWPDAGIDQDNTLAAKALCKTLGLSEPELDLVIPHFKKPPHRIQFIRTVGGIDFYDDSKGTNIDAVVQAVRAMKGKVVLIAGGVDKGTSYLAWKRAFAGKVTTIIAIGQAAAKIEEELSPFFTVKRSRTLVTAVQDAMQEAKKEGDKANSVLLSPGCASYDMFRNYVDRGEEFQRIVNAL